MPRKILAIRHGQSVWNVLREKYPSEDERYGEDLYAPDCDITELGAQQSRQAGRELMELLSATAREEETTSINVRFVVSPLRRALQTAQGIFQGAAQVDSNWKPTTVIVQPLAAEILMDSCDIGTPVANLKKEFPAPFDMNLVEQQATPDGGFWWRFQQSPQETWERMKQRLPEGTESTAQAQERIASLREFLREDKTCQEADVVVVVCHSETIWYLTSRPGADGDRYGTWTKNGEIVDLKEHILGKS
ncbi:Pfam:PGAM [Seminavis robusta]|uniref:Pfam:PGAM n=1 Tax=Seminavis robusta TaxID=568900 RepID=A0A9N8DY78_9STRA|nr:Pfam:PGAM [Seminavis robusta]|eukprot:Sro468_g149210.1 Pfam:PGAM (248) ;mRNA; f:48283-49136